MEIHSEFILLKDTPSTAQVLPPLGADLRADIILEGNGFFIKGHYIIAPAHLVLLPPSLSGVAQRWPLFDANAPAGVIQNSMIRASRILVSVFGVNGADRAFAYEADLVGVDGAGDIAVLRINPRRQWNLCNPCIKKCHPYLSFSKDRCAAAGEKVYLLGDIAGDAKLQFNAVGGLAEGKLADPRYIDYSGFMLAESILVSAAAYAQSSGIPILNCRGEVLGMQTTDLSGDLPAFEGSPLPIACLPAKGFGRVAGPSKHFMIHVIKAIIKGSCTRKYSPFLSLVCDPIGPYYSYNKAYAGIAYDVFTAPMYDVTVDYTSGPAPSGQPRIRLDANGNFLSSPGCKELMGIRVLGLAGANPEDSVNGVPNGYWFVPGGTATTPLASGLPVSPFLGQLLPGDVITHMEGEKCSPVPLGDLECQFAPSFVTWRKTSNDTLSLNYRRGGNALNAGPNYSTENYDQYYEYTACLAAFPPLMDYPWYAVNKFPLLGAQPYSFNFGSQIKNPQYPALQEGAPFHPAF